MHIKIKKSKLKLIISIVVLIVLLSLIPILLNLKKYLGIGYYYEDKNYSNSYNGGTGGIYLKFTIEHQEIYDNLGTITIQTTSSGNVDQIGIVYLEYTIKKGSATLALVDSNNNPPVKFYSRTYRIYHLNANDILLCNGEADVIFNINDLNHTEIINFEIAVLIRIGNDEIHYNWELTFIWINILYYLNIIFVIFLIRRFYKSMKRESWYTEELKKKDDEFFKKITFNEDLDESRQ